MVCTSDSGMKLYEIEEYSDHEYITGYHAWNVTYFSIGCNDTKSRFTKSGFKQEMICNNGGYL